MKLSIHPLAFLVGCVLFASAWIALRPFEAPIAGSSGPSSRGQTRAIHRTVIDVPRDALRRYEGNYWGDAAVKIALEGETLVAHPSGYPPLALAPSGEHEFYVKEVDANVLFEMDDDGRPKGLVARFASGGEFRARRVR